jgi:hypothetical protein
MTTQKEMSNEDVHDVCVSIVGKRFADRKECSVFVQNLALSQGKRAVVDKKRSGGKSVIFICSSQTPCSFQVRILKSMQRNVHWYFVSSTVLEHNGCTGYKKATRRQVEELQVAVGAVAVSPSTPARVLMDQIKITNGVAVPSRMMYRARDCGEAVVE